MNDLKKEQFNIIRIHVLVTCLLIILSIFLFKDCMPIVKGFIFGGSIGVLNFLLLGNTIVKALKMSSHSAKIFVRINYLVRYIIIGVVLFVSVKAEYINAISVLIGLLLVKYIIVFVNFFEKRSYKKNN